MKFLRVSAIGFLFLLSSGAAGSEAPRWMGDFHLDYGTNLGEESAQEDGRYVVNALGAGVATRVSRWLSLGIYGRQTQLYDFRNTTYADDTLNSGNQVALSSGVSARLFLPADLEFTLRLGEGRLHPMIKNAKSPPVRLKEADFSLSLPIYRGTGLVKQLNWTNSYTLTRLERSLAGNLEREMISSGFEWVTAPEDAFPVGLTCWTELESKRCLSKPLRTVLIKWPKKLYSTAKGLIWN